MARPKAFFLDYVAGNIRSLVNAVEKVGYEVHWIKHPSDIPNAEVAKPNFTAFRFFYCFAFIMKAFLFFFFFLFFPFFSVFFFCFRLKTKKKKKIFFWSQ